MAGFEKVGGLIRQFKFNSAEKRALGALQIVSESQRVVNKWLGNKYEGKFLVKALSYDTENRVLTLGADNAPACVEVRKSAYGLILSLNKVLGKGTVRKIRVKVQKYA